MELRRKEAREGTAPKEAFLSDRIARDASAPVLSSFRDREVAETTGALQNLREVNFQPSPTASTEESGIICCEVKSFTQAENNERKPSWERVGNHCEAKSSTFTIEINKAPSRDCVKNPREAKEPLQVEDLGGLDLGDLDPPGLGVEDLGAPSLGVEDPVYPKSEEEEDSLSSSRVESLVLRAWLVSSTTPNSQHRSLFWTIPEACWKALDPRNNILKFECDRTSAHRPNPPSKSHVAAIAAQTNNIVKAESDRTREHWSIQPRNITNSAAAVLSQSTTDPPLAADISHVFGGVFRRALYRWIRNQKFYNISKIQGANTSNVLEFDLELNCAKKAHLGTPPATAHHLATFLEEIPQLILELDTWQLVEVEAEVASWVAACGGATCRRHLVFSWAITFTYFPSNEVGEIGLGNLDQLWYIEPRRFSAKECVRWQPGSEARGSSLHLDTLVQGGYLATFGENYSRIYLELWRVAPWRQEDLAWSREGEVNDRAKEALEPRRGRRLLVGFRLTYLAGIPIFAGAKEDTREPWSYLLQIGGERLKGRRNRVRQAILAIASPFFITFNKGFGDTGSGERVIGGNLEDFVTVSKSEPTSWYQSGWRNYTCWISGSEVIIGHRSAAWKIRSKQGRLEAEWISVLSSFVFSFLEDFWVDFSRFVSVSIQHLVASCCLKLIEMAPRKAKTIEPETVEVEGEHVRVEETRVVERGESSGTNDKLDLILTQLAGVTQTIAHMDGRLNHLEQRRNPPRSHSSSYYRRNEPIGAVSEAFLGDARRASLGGPGIDTEGTEVAKVEEEAEVQEEVLCHALTNNGLNALKVVGKINNQKVIVLLDTGSTHNFLNSRLAHLVEGKVTPLASFNVLVGNGERMSCNEVCKDVSLKMQKTPFTLDLYLLPIGGVDLVLGIQWMKPLKRTLLDWENMTLTFPKEGGGEITLEAINPSVDPKPALRALDANQPAFCRCSLFFLVDTPSRSLPRVCLLSLSASELHASSQCSRYPLVPLFLARGGKLLLWRRARQPYPSLFTTTPPPFFEKRRQAAAEEKGTTALSASDLLEVA
ncbi:hypothetical protein EJ110_NYTH49129 [Nymphaea thermarum]|nr:hypothetical protein EJ110_NYTH49129 [Nymphaea thermarum]